jgi:hypothetical protein
MVGSDGEVNCCYCVCRSDFENEGELPCLRVRPVGGPASKALGQLRHVHNTDNVARVVLGYWQFLFC